MRIANTVAAALLTCCAATPAMADGQVKLSLRDLSTTLSDLDPHDGSAAGLSWDPYAALATRIVERQQTAWTTQPWGPGRLWTPSWNQLQFQNLSSFDTELTGRNPIGDHRVRADHAGSIDGSIYLAGVAGSDRELYVSAHQGFTLAPNTQVRISMLFDGRLLGPAQDQAFPLDPQDVIGQAHVALGFDTSLSVYRYGPIEEGSTYLARNEFGQWNSGHGALGLELDGTMLSLTISNTGAEATHYMLNAIASARYMETLAPVPEPSGPALMGAGLLAIAVLRRRANRHEATAARV